MQMIYVFDENKVYVGPEIVSDDYETNTSRDTTVAPQNGLYEPITWKGTNWIGTNKGDYDKVHLNSAASPTTDQQLIMVQAQQMLMAQAADIAKLKQGVDQS